MSYEPTEWKSGDVITSAKLNKMENGIQSASGGGGVLVVNAPDGETLNKTWKEIHDAGFAVLFNEPDSYRIMVALYSEDGEYGVGFWNPEASGVSYFVADSENGYPTYRQDTYE